MLMSYEQYSQIETQVLGMPYEQKIQLLAMIVYLFKQNLSRNVVQSLCSRLFDHKNRPNI